MGFLSSIFKPVGKLVSGVANGLGIGEVFNSVASPISTAKGLADMQQENNIAMWNLQNEYNTPAKQMERLAEAGLNPNLAYEKATTGNAETPASADYQAAGLQSQQQAREALFSLASTAINFIKSQSQIKTQEAQTDMYEQLAQKYASDAALSNQQRLWNGRMWTDEYLNALHNQAIGKGYQDLSLGTLKKLFVDMGAASYDENGNLIDYPLANLIKSRYSGEMAINWAQPELQNARIHQIMAATNLTRAQAGRLALLLPFEKTIYDQRGRLLGLQADYQNLFNQDFDTAGGLKLPFGIGSVGGAIRGAGNFFDWLNDTVFSTIADGIKKQLGVTK